MLHKYQYILWDFDGVIINSDTARISGFETVLAGYPQHEVAELLEFHKKNGGLSRYVKFRYFFEDIRKEAVSEQQINALAEDFSRIMKKILPDPKLLIRDSVDFIVRNSGKMPMHIVSGSDGNELRFLCNALGIDQYFDSISGSPTPKIQLVHNLIESGAVQPAFSCLIGDSENDFEAAEKNRIDFWGYNNSGLVGLGKGYIHQFSSIAESDISI